MKDEKEERETETSKMVKHGKAGAKNKGKMRRQISTKNERHMGKM